MPQPDTTPIGVACLKKGPCRCRNSYPTTIVDSVDTLGAKATLPLPPRSETITALLSYGHPDREKQPALAPNSALLNRSADETYMG